MSFITDALNAAVGKMEIRTRYGPTITLDEPFAPSPSAEGSPTTQYLKPVITLFARDNVTSPVVIAPYGDPGDTLWPYVVAGGGLLLGFLAFRAFGR